MKTVTVPVIRTQADYEEAVAQVEKLWGAKPDTPKAEKLDVLLTLVDAYESEQFSIDAPDPIEAILFRMDQEGYERRDLEALLGKSRVSELLNRKRSLTLNMIRKLHEAWNIPADVLVRKVA
tara:strand:- start:4517 stop:4882 length:366 start_codon:yes stop_codon:yes gene_type:complete